MADHGSNVTLEMIYGEVRQVTSDVKQVTGDVKHVIQNQEKQEAAYLTHLQNCREEKKELFDRMKLLELAAERTAVFQGDIIRSRKAMPHWVHSITVVIATALSIGAAWWGLTKMGFH